MSLSRSLGIKQWYEGVKQSESLTSPRTSRAEAAGVATRGALVGGATGLAVGIADSLLPGGLSAGKVGLAAGAAFVGAVAAAHSPLGKVFSDANIALSALAMREYAGNKTAHAAGTTSAVLTNKAKAIAAHGESQMGGGDMGEDPLIAAGARIFGS